MHYNLEKRVFLVKKFYQFGSYAPVQSAYRVQFGLKTAPDRRTIMNIIKVFEKTGSVLSPLQKNRKLQNKRELAKTEVTTLITEQPNLSIRKLASAVNVSQTLIFHILHDDLHLKPYKLQKLHKLEVRH